MRIAICLLSTLLAIEAAHAGDCPISSGQRPTLSSETLDWSFVIASGRQCLRGLRSGAMLLESVRISRPARHGDARTEGYAFAYHAAPTFKGNDSFVVTMSGAIRGVRGTSTIRVNVVVR